MPFVAPKSALASIGHNGGPPLDLSFSAHAWRKAHAKAWRTPPREIALARLKRAERVGLTYRDYASVLMDRGSTLSVVVMAPGVLKAGPAAAVRAKLAAIRGATLFILSEPHDLLDAAWLEGASEVIRAPRAGLAGAVRAALKERLLPPASAFMVGQGAADRQVCEDCGLPLFKPAAEYFAGA